MKKRARLLSAMLSTSMVISLMPTAAFADVRYTPGDYAGQAMVSADEDGDFDDYTLNLNISVDENGTITDVKDFTFGETYDTGNDSYVTKAKSGKKNAGGMVDLLVGKTLTEVQAMDAEADAVSGATCTSKAIVEAVQDAAGKATLTGAEAVTVDTSALVSAISDAEAAKEVSSETYTAESIAEYAAAIQAAIDRANAVLEAAESQEAVDGAVTDLDDAVEAAKSLLQEVEIPEETETPEEPQPEETVNEAMVSVSVGGVTYYYADTEGDAANTVYQVSVTTGRGPSASTTVYDYTKSDLTQVEDSTIYQTTAPGAAALSGTLYGYGDGTATNYRAVYGAAATEDPAYDAVSSATNYTGYHAKDISSVVTYGTDANGNKAITGLKLGRTTKSVDAEAYVAASVLKAAGKELTEAQNTALDIQLKKNPMSAPAENTIAVSGTGTYTTSRYGDGEFAIVPDESAEGYVWSEYWDNVYGATISDGTTTVGTVHWIDLYGEAATSGPHYNKIEIALNNGESVASNAAQVSRFAAFYDANTGNVKPGTYTITVMADGYSNLVTEVTIPAETMSSVSVGGVTYYYADTEGDAANTVYQVSVTTGRGPSAVTTVYNYTKNDLTQVADSTIYQITAPGAAALSGTLYGYGDGTATNYRAVYGAAATEDPAYDAVSSATNYTGYHAKDISSVVTYGTDANGNKAITGLKLGRTTKSVDAEAYVAASVLKAAGKELTEAQNAALDIQLKQNPMSAPAEDTIAVSGTGTYTTSRYGDGEFAIVPDESAEGYVWSEYWDNVYGATISDGTTTVGTVHWIDLYGEAATSGPHYNKIEIALNNGESVASNAAQVSRFAAFYDAEGNVKPGTYTITVMADGYSDLTVSVEVEKREQTVTVDQESLTAKIGDASIALQAAAKTEISYTSSNDAVATVDENGVITFNGAGDAVITVSAAENDQYKAATATVSVHVDYLATPAISTVKNVSTGVQITWSAVTGAEKYSVYRKTGTGAWKGIGSATSTSYIDKTAVGGQTYTYTVRCVSADGKVKTSKYDTTGKTILYLADTKVSAITNGSAGVEITWNKGAGAKGYYVYRKVTGGSYTRIATVTSGSTATYTDKSTLTNGTSYEYAVRAYNGSSVGTYTAAKSIYLTKPAISKVSNSAKGAATVTWNKNSKATGYQICYKVGSVKKYVTIKNNTTVSTVLKSLTKGKTYYVYVRSYKTDGGKNYYSSWSTNKSVKITK